MNKKKILIIEDDTFLCETLSMCLKRHGFCVLVAHDGKEGLKKALGDSPDCILLDLNLPYICGEEICRQIRKLDGEKRIPIIMETAKDTDVDRVVGKVIGADCYLSKPFSLKDLLLQIERLLPA